MKVLIQDTASKRYLKTSEQWTRQLGQAKNFEYLERAAEFVRRRKLKNVQFALALPLAGEILAIPIVGAH